MISFPRSIQVRTRVTNGCELGIHEAKVILAGPAGDPHPLPPAQNQRRVPMNQWIAGKCQRVARPQSRNLNGIYGGGTTEKSLNAIGWIQDRIARRTYE